jgi:hypothetical protein
MERLRAVPFCQALDQGNILQIAEMAGLNGERSQQVRDRVGDCGLCRLAFARLSRRQEYDWIQTAPLSNRETTFYGARLGQDTLHELL